MNLRTLLRLLPLLFTLASVLHEAVPFLELLAADDYEGASARLLSTASLQDDLARLDPAVVAALPILLPLLVKLLDQLIPEEKLLAALHGEA